MTECTRRELRNVTRLALQRTAQDGGVAWEDRSRARAALAQLDGQAKPGLRDIIWQTQVQPGLRVVVEDSTNILLELRAGVNDGELIGRTNPLGISALMEALTLARLAADQARDDAEQERLRGLAEYQAAVRWSEPRDGEDAASRACAATELSAAGLSAHSAQLVLKRAWGHLSATFNVDGTDQLGTVTYNREHGTYHVRVPEAAADCGDPARHSAHYYEGGNAWCEGIA